MANLKELKNRISSVKSTKKITKAMQMVAASKLRKAQEAAKDARPYADRMETVLNRLASSVSDPEGASPLLVSKGEEKVHLLVVMTADRGLCGGFNVNIVKRARNHMQKLLDQGKTVKLFCVGKKGADVLRRKQADRIVESKSLSDVKEIKFGTAKEIADTIKGMFDEDEFDVCTLFYAKFISAIEQSPTDFQLIPNGIPEADDDGSDTGDVFYDYEPDKELVLENLLDRNIATQIFRALLENKASEQGARMTAMDNATRNADEMIEDLEKTYNRERQAKITNELIEIISGAEAL